MIQNLNIYLWNMKVGSLVAFKKENRQGLIFQLLGDSSVVPLGLEPRLPDYESGALTN